MADQPTVVEGRGRLLPGGVAAPARITFDGDRFTLATGGDVRVVAYRDVSTVAVQQGTTLLVLGSGPGAERFLLDQLGAGLGQLVRELRERRLRQRLGDALITVSDDPIALVEYDDGARNGVGLLAYDGWGATLAPLDEQVPWIRIRRSRIAAVETTAADGTVEVALGDPRAGGVGGTAAAGGRLRLVGLGQAARVHGDRLTGLRAAAQADAGRLIGALIPDAAYGARQEAARLLIDGQPARPADLPLSWTEIEAGVLVEPTFASSYAALRAKAGSLAQDRAIAISPMDPGGDEARSWFFVALPGNLVALELVSSGAHATYCFRVQSRAAAITGATDPVALAEAVREISEALVDTRFLREPMALPDDALRQPKYLRYRLALAALPTLAAARARFVARIVHRDDASWAAALDDLIVWHGAERDDEAVWPGRAAQEAMVDEAAAGDDSASAGDAEAAAQDASVPSVTVPPSAPSTPGGS